MLTRTPQGNVGAVLVGMLLCAAGGLCSVGYADVTASGLGTVVNQPSAGVFDITGGTRPGNGPNLFHSFGDFGLGAPESAHFLNDSGLPTTNILGRVTGGNPSNIFGMIDSSDFTGANLFLMNPAGILFGATAQLNVDGSFHATTADYLGLTDGTRFNALPSAADALLTTATPNAFGFLTTAPAPIDVSTQQFGILQVPEGETLSLVGGTINIGAPDGSAPGFLLAPSGRVNLVSVASPGEVTFESGGINVDSFAQLGDINITGGSVVDGKEVFIRGGQLVIDNALVFPGGFSLFGLSAPPNGGEVNIQVTNDVVITGTQLVPVFQDIPGIQTFVGSSSEILPAADVPDITIEAGGSVSLSGVAVVQTIRLGPGNPAEVVITADTVSVTNGAAIASINTYAGPGDNITVNANVVELSGEGAPGFTGLAAQAQFHPGFGNLATNPFDPNLTLADGGTITVNADTLIVRAGAEISADSFAFGSSGDIIVNAGNIFLSDGAVIAAQSILAGDAGNVTITASGRIEITDSRISASTGGSGDGGVVDISASESISVVGEIGIFSSTLPPPDQELDDFASLFGSAACCTGVTDFASLVSALGLDPDTADIFDVLGALNGLAQPLVPPLKLTPGTGGQITIATPNLTVGAGAAISSSTGWDGDAGTIEGNVGHLDVNSGAEIRSRSGLVVPGTAELLVGNGNAGTVDFTASVISVSGPGSSISTTTLGDGNGGNILLSSASNIEILDGGSITADSFGAGLTGNISIAAGGSIVMNNGTISTQAVTSDGGNIKLDAPAIIQLTHSTITTSVESGVGGGGNIDIDPEFVTLNASQIIANAFGGPGGNIRIVAGNFIPSADSTVQASSTLSTQGNIVIESPENDIAGSISQLPQSFFDASTLLPERCAARRAGGRSSFVVAGPGGVAPNPDGYLPSFNAGVLPPLERAAGPASGAAGTALAQAKDIALAMAIWNCSQENGRPVLSQDAISQLF